MQNEDESAKVDKGEEIVFFSIDQVCTFVSGNSEINTPEISIKKYYKLSKHLIASITTTIIDYYLLKKISELIIIIYKVHYISVN